MTDLEQTTIKRDAIVDSVTYKNRNNEQIMFYKDDISEELKTLLSNIGYSLDVNLDLSYQIMDTAISTLSDLDIDYIFSDRLDLYADVDSRANVYTGIQLSYLNINNESEISDIMKDESIDSIAIACQAWYNSKVLEALEQLISYIKA